MMHGTINVKYYWVLLGAFAKLDKTATSLVMSIRLSVPLSARTNSSRLEGFLLNFIFEYFLKKSVLKIQVSLKSDRNKEYFTR